MDDDDFENFEDVTDAFAHFFAPPQQQTHRFRPIDAVVLTLLGLHEFSQATTTMFRTAYNAAASHANYRQDQEAMRTEAALEIETMTAGEENG